MSKCEHGILIGLICPECISGKDLIGHPWADESGVITSKKAATVVANWILLAGGKASTAMKCAELMALEFEKEGTGR